MPVPPTTPATEVLIHALTSKNASAEDVAKARKHALHWWPPPPEAIEPERDLLAVSRRDQLYLLDATIMECLELGRGRAEGGEDCNALRYMKLSAGFASALPHDWEDGLFDKATRRC